MSDKVEFFDEAQNVDSALIDQITQHVADDSGSKKARFFCLSSDRQVSDSGSLRPWFATE